MKPKNSFKLGVTLYSFNAEYHSYRYSFEDCMAAAGSLGPGQGVELVGPMMIRSYPRLSAEFESRFKAAVEKYQLVPTAYSGYTDISRYYGRLATREEQHEFLISQIKAAKQLGFSIIRLRPDDPFITDELLPYAERAGIKIGMEIHSPMMLEKMQEVIEKVDRINSPYLGFIPDGGAFCDSCATVYISRFRRQGVDGKIIDRILQMWAQRATGDEIHAEVERMGGDDLAHLMATESQVYFGHSDPKMLKRIMPRIVQVHGKFFGVDDGTEKVSAVRLPEIVAELNAGGFSGYVSCEYEAHHWTAELDALDQVRRLQNKINDGFALARP